ncbi:hypothetical protein [Companilactobacillus farciminis]|uniref:hypothetical protein n=1 Tax=Companilactobacillus farciminis TaxID=1612 RepID=UPI001915BAA4|nr:hypothetical protein [Companilactobacillus farciminis]
MNDFAGLSKNLIREKWRLMNWIVGIDILALIVLFIMYLISNGFSGSTNYFFQIFVVSVTIVNFISFIMLSRKNEHVFTSNNYRLLPVTDTTLYISNLFTTFVAFVYLQVLETIIAAILYAIGNFGNIESSDFSGASSGMGILFGAVVFMILVTLVMWSGITLIHFLISWIKGFLPFKSQKFVTFILYLVVIWGASVIFDIATGYIYRWIYTAGYMGAQTLSQITNAVWITSGIMLVWLLIFSFINIYLMKRWVETIR